MMGATALGVRLYVLAAHEEDSPAGARTTSFSSLFAAFGQWAVNRYETGTYGINLVAICWRSPSLSFASP